MISYIKIQWKRIRKYIFRQWIYLVLAGALFTSVFLFYQSQYQGKVLNSPIHIGVVLEEQGSFQKFAEFCLSQIGRTREALTLYSATYEEGKRLLEKGSLDALIVIPKEAAEGIITGENTPVTVYIHARTKETAGYVKSMLVKELTACMASIIDSAQRQSIALNEQDMISALDQSNLQIVLSRDSTFLDEKVVLSGDLTILEYYMTALLTLLFLFQMPLFWRFLLESRELQLLLHRKGIRIWKQELFKIVLTCLALLIPVSILAAYQSDWKILIGLLPGIAGNVIWMYLFIVIACPLDFRSIQGSVSEQRTTTVLYLFSMILMVFLAGMVIPDILLPERLQSIGVNTPVGILFREMKQCFWLH